MLGLGEVLADRLRNIAVLCLGSLAALAKLRIGELRADAILENLEPVEVELGVGGRVLRFANFLRRSFDHEAFAARGGRGVGGFCLGSRCGDPVQRGAAGGGGGVGGVKGFHVHRVVVLSVWQ